VAVLIGTFDAKKGVKASARIYDIDAAEKAAREATLDLAPDSSTKAFALPAVPGIGKTYFLRLRLTDAAGALLSDNFYWLSTKPDTLDWAHKKDTVYTPQKDFGDLTGLNSLPQVKVEATPVLEANPPVPGKLSVMSITVKNPGASIAFMVHMRLTAGQDGVDMTPVFWEDNYFSLLPGETRVVRVSYAAAAQPTVLHVDGYNVAPFTVEP
jgi:exo-1,4-beta-D-glucosaminidase